MLKAHTWYHTIPKCMSLSVCRQLEGTHVANKPTYEELIERNQELEKIVDERKHAEENLMQEKAFTESILNSLPGAFYLYDENQRLIRWNKNFEILSGYSAEELFHKAPTDFFEGEDIKKISQALEQVVNEVKVTYEANVKIKDGTKIPYLMTGSLLTQDNKKYMLGVSFDITERKLAEEELRTSEERFRSLVANIPGAVYRCDRDPDWTMRFLSDAIADICGYPASDFMGNRVRTYASLIHPDDRDMVEKTVESGIESGEPFAIEYRVHNAAGKVRWVYERGMGVFGEDGKVQYLDGAIFDISERRQAEEVIKSSERNYREVFNATSEAILIHDGETGEILDVNQTALDLFGFSYEEALGLTVEELSSGEAPYSQPEVLGRIRKAVEEGPHVFDWRSKKKSGEHFWSSVSLKSSRIGGKGRVLAAVRDITNKKEAEERLRESESRYRSLFESANDAIIILKDVVFVDCNRKALEMFGCAREQIIGKPPYTFSPINQPDGSASREKALENIKTAYEGKPQIFEWRHKKYDGTPFDAQISLNLVELSTGIHLQAIVRDITEKKSLDKQIRLMQHWVEQSVDLFFWVREDSRILYVNQAVCASLGYTKEEFLTMKVSDFDLGLPLEAWPNFTHKLREQGSHCFETRLRKKNGQVFPVEITANILNFEGKTHFFAYGRDISAKVNAEEKRKELENLLIQAQKMEAIGTLAGGIAHDFNNILSAIIGFTEISIRDVPSGSKLEHNLQRVLNAGIRAGDLVKQILTFSRQTDREIKPVQVKPIVKEALKLIKASLPATIEIRQDIRSDSPIMADPTQVHQIIMNLCTNAAQAMKDSGGRMVVSLIDVQLGADVIEPHPDMAPGPFIKLTVSDSGCGIAPKIKDRIFDPFYTTKELGEGTGLGLAVVHGIVKDSGGMVSVASTPGKGSTFDAFFPVIANEQGPEIVTHTPLPTGSERILFVDDEEYQVEMGKQVLELLGYRVTTKTSSPEALKVFRAKPDAFDLVVTDLTMPQMTGDVLAKEIMTIRPDLPIILCTGYSEKITTAKAKALGIKEVVMKPAVVEEIARTVRRVLDQTIED
jgi:PAS domain S-box-containing protein